MQTRARTAAYLTRMLPDDALHNNLVARPSFPCEDDLDLVRYFPRELRARLIVVLLHEVKRSDENHHRIRHA